MKTLRTILATVLAVLVIEVLMAAGVVYGGWFDVAANHSYPLGLEGLLETAQARAVDARAEEALDSGAMRRPDDLTDPGRIQRGMLHYEAMCVRCHGAPGRRADTYGRGMDPQPPDLWDEVREPAETFWVVDNGIKMTGMPAFGDFEEPDELWDIAAFVQQLPGLDATTYADRLAEARTAFPGEAEHEEAEHHEAGEEHETEVQ